MAWLKYDILKDYCFRMPKVACCYVIYIGGELAYIGSTNNMLNRFNEHGIRHGYGKNYHTPWGMYDNTVPILIKYRPSKKYGDWLMVEARLIKRLQPKFNKKLKGRKVA